MFYTLLNCCHSKFKPNRRRSIFNAQASRLSELRKWPFAIFSLIAAVWLEHFDNPVMSQSRTSQLLINCYLRCIRLRSTSYSQRLKSVTFPVYFVFPLRNVMELYPIILYFIIVIAVDVVVIVFCIPMFFFLISENVYFIQCLTSSCSFFIFKWQKKKRWWY